MSQISMFAESLSADKDDYSTWPENQIYFIDPSCCKFNTTWLTVRTVLSVDRIVCTNAKGKRTSDEIHITVKTQFAKSTFPMSDKMKKRYRTKAEGVKIIREILKNDFCGERQHFESILSEIEMADNPVVFAGG